MAPFVVLVTGGTGFVGRWFITALQEDFSSRGEELEVRVISRSAKPRRALKDVSYVKGSISNADDVKTVLEGVSAVFHIAGMKPTAAAKRAKYHKANVLTTQVLLEQSKASGSVRYFVLTSTMVGVDGSKSKFQLLSPNAVLPSKRGRNGNYAWSKSEAEKVVKEHTSAELKTLVLRLGGLYGPGDEHFFDEIKKGGPKLMPGGGSGIFDCVDVQSVGTAHIAALKALRDDTKDVSGKTYNVGNCQEAPYTSLKQFYTILAGGKKPRALPASLMMFVAYLNDFAFTVFNRGVTFREVLPSSMRSSVYSSWQLDSTATMEDLEWEPVYKTVGEAREAFLAMGDDHP